MSRAKSHCYSISRSISPHSRVSPSLCIWKGHPSFGFVSKLNLQVQHKYFKLNPGFSFIQTRRGKISNSPFPAMIFFLLRSINE